VANLTREQSNGLLCAFLRGQKGTQCSRFLVQDAMCRTSKHRKECDSSSVCHPRKKWVPDGASGHELSRPKRVSWLPAYRMMWATSIPVSCGGWRRTSS